MKFTLLALVAGLLATPGTSIPDDLTIQDFPSCKKYDEVLKKTTNSQCSYDLLGKSKKCEKVLGALPEKTLIEIALRSKKCSDDVIQKVKQTIEDRILESVIADLENDDQKKTQPVEDKKNSSRTAKKIYGKKEKHLNDEICKLLLKIRKI